MTAITPIETRYAGCRFRSRLEARWAVFFDALAIPWEYEPQGFAFDGFAYLPDFWLPHQNVWYEVKPRTVLDCCWDLLEGFQYGVQGRVVLAAGNIPRPDRFYPACMDDDDADFYMAVVGDCYYAWCRCDKCGATDVQYEGRAERNCKCNPGQDKGREGAYHPDILAAYTLARSARFEHGEKP